MSVRLQPEPLGTPDTNPDIVGTDGLSPSPGPHGTIAVAATSTQAYRREDALLVQLVEINNELSVMVRESLRGARGLERTVARLRAEADAQLQATPTLVHAGVAATGQS